MTTFDSLSTRRRALVDALHDNGAEDGLRRVLADLYPDNAHFIYELLQNAEDARASEVTFRLKDDGLLVEHDGPRLFDLSDIDSITGIGQSTKSDDATSIGEFGVGFKAVFAYTQTPAIHSGEHSFEIHDLLVPTRIGQDGRPDCTVFWFPFDREDKPAPRAVEEVARALRDVSRSTLLFLNHIATILCVFPDGDERLLGRRSITDRVIAIESAHENEGPSYWYSITGDVSIDEKLYPVAAAFALTKNETPAEDGQPPRTAARASATTSKSAYTVSLITGQVFIYFPAVKETSGLKFHIHAPFASTVARDSVRDDDRNDRLVEGIADIVASALPDMCRLGLVNDGLLGALPNKDDDLPARYAVVRKKVLEAFQTKPLTPKHGGGGFAPSSQLIRSVGPLRAVLSIKDASSLRRMNADSDLDAAGWLPDRDGRPKKFLESLEAIDFGSAELAEVFGRIGKIRSKVVDDEDRSVLRSWHEWLEAQNDEWLRSFYAALGRLTKQSHNPYQRGDYRYRVWRDPLTDSLADVAIVRVQSPVGGPRHVRGHEAFLPVTAGLRGEGLVVDSLVAFPDGEDPEAIPLRDFYSAARVKEWDAAAQLDARLVRYADREADVSAEHLGDLADLAKLIESKEGSPNDYRDRKILVGKDRNGTASWTAPTSLYLDDPFGSSGLSALYGPSGFGGHSLLALAAEYEGQPPDVAALAQKLGAVAELTIKRAPIFRNLQFKRSWRSYENDNKVAEDWVIEDFEAIVETDHPRLLEGLWQVVVSAPEACGTATYRANASRKSYEIESQLVQTLRTVPWVLDRDGNRRLPAAATRDDLAESFEWRDAPLLKLAGFGKEAELAAAKQGGDDTDAKKFGFSSAEDARFAAKVLDEDPEAFREFREERKARRSVALPEASSRAPERRASRVAERAADAPRRRHEIRERSVRVQQPGFRDASKQYLRTLYTNEDGLMTCQVCRTEMPFKINREYYFEAVQFLGMTQRDLEVNALALCPTCAAKYRNARGTDYGDLRDDLLTQRVGDSASVTVDVVLADEPELIRFVGTHAIDLQAALEAIEGSILDEGDDEDGYRQAQDARPGPGPSHQPA